MGKRLVEQIVSSLAKANWPANTQATALGRKTYEIGLDQVDSYHHDPKPLAAALRTFLGGDSAPYAMAGVAYVLLAAAQENDGSFDQEGVAHAQRLLEKAQSYEPDQLEINFIEALVYIYGDRLEDARLVLDYLWSVDPTFYYLSAAEVAFWQQSRDLEQTVHWCQQASNAAASNPQRLRWRRTIAENYLAFKQYDKAIPAFREAIHVDPQSAELWHHLALVYWRMENDAEAERANQQALRFQSNYQPALDLVAAMEEKKKAKSTGRLGSLFRRS
jgi:predicted Zn-dependent protease